MAQIYYLCAFATAIFIVPTACIFSLYSDVIVSFALGDKFLPIIKISRITILGAIIYAVLVTSSGAILTAVGKPWFNALRAIVSLSINAILIFILAPKYGLLGLAWSFTSSYIAGSLLFLIFLRRLHICSIRIRFILPIFACAGLYLINSYLLHENKIAALFIDSLVVLSIFYHIWVNCLNDNARNRVILLVVQTYISICRNENVK